MTLTKKLLLLTIFLFSKFTLIQAQETKKIKQNYSYTDAFEDLKDGEAEYEYYLDKNQQKVLNGNFKIFKRYEDISILVSGNYINNKKNGLWIYKYMTYEIGINVNTLTTKKGVTYNSSVSGESTNIPDLIKTHEIIYKNDTITDKFVFNLQQKNNGKLITISELKIGLNSINKIYTGPVECMVIPTLETRKITLTGNFDEKGAPHGLWVCNNIKEERFRTNISETNLQDRLLKIESNYDHGILLSEKVTDIATSELLINYIRKEPEVKDTTLITETVYFRLPDDRNYLHQQYDSASSVFAFDGRFNFYNKEEKYKNNYESSPHYFDFSNFTLYNKMIGNFKFIHDLLPSLPSAAPYIYALEKDKYASMIGRKVYVKKITPIEQEKIINYKNLFQSKTPSWASSNANRKSLENWYGYCNSINYYFKEYAYIEDINKLLNNQYPLDKYAEYTYPFVYEDGISAFEAPALPNKNWQKHYYASTDAKKAINFYAWYNYADKYMKFYLKDKYLSPSNKLVNLFSKQYFVTYLAPYNKNNTQSSSFVPDHRQLMIYGYNNTDFTERFYKLTQAIVNIYNENEALETIIDSESHNVKILKKEYAVDLIKLARIEKSMIDTFNLKLARTYLDDTIAYFNLINEYIPKVESFYKNIDRVFRPEFLDLYKEMKKKTEDIYNYDPNKEMQNKKYFKNAYALINYNGINNFINFEDVTKYFEVKNKIIDKIIAFPFYDKEYENNAPTNINLFRCEGKTEGEAIQDLDILFYNPIKDTITDEFKANRSYDSILKLRPKDGSNVNGNWIKTNEEILKAYNIELNKISEVDIYGKRTMIKKRALNRWKLNRSGCSYKFNNIKYFDLFTKNYGLLKGTDTLLFKQMLDSTDINLLIVKENRKEIINLASKVNNEFLPLQQQIFIKYKVTGLNEVIKPFQKEIVNKDGAKDVVNVQGSSTVYVNNIYHKKIIFMAYYTICNNYTRALHSDSERLWNTKELVKKYDKIKQTAEAILKIADKSNTSDLEDQLKGKSADEAMELILKYQ